jgi:hypothetical protein
MPAWEVRQRDYASEAPPLPSSTAEKHPLFDAAQRIQRIAEADKKQDTPTGGEKVVDISDPLSATAGADPLSAAASDPLSGVGGGGVTADPLGAASVNADPLGAIGDPLGAIGDPLSGGGGGGGGGGGSDPLSGGLGASRDKVLLAGGTVVAAPGTGSTRVAGWKEKRAMILKSFSATGQLKVNSDLLDTSGGNASALGSNLDDAGPSGEKKVALDSKTRRRLEQLETTEDDGRTVRLTQTELVARVDKLNAELRNAWLSDERVRALKIAIQVSKMLGDTSYPTFFPTVFAVVAEILDAFGELVYERVLAKGTPPGKVLPPGFSPDEVAEEGAETTRNWFYKVASIRELVPRFYVELAILKCYRLLMPAEELPGLVDRLMRSLRGFGDPLAATCVQTR